MSRLLIWMTKEYIYIYICMFADVRDYTYVGVYIHIYILLVYYLKLLILTRGTLT